MIKLNPECCRSIKEARRAAGLSQSEVANEIGCKQSALSMFESGDGTKLNDEVIKKLAAKFGIALDLPTSSSTVAAPICLAHDAEVHSRGFCPNANCLSNKTFSVNGETHYLPNRQAADPVGGKFCALCGEILEKRCPTCGAPIHEGAFCSFCGRPYVAIG